MTIEQLKEEIRRNLEDMYVHENDAEYYEDLCRNLEDENPQYEYNENCAEWERQAAYQLEHVVRCDISQLESITGKKYSYEDFVN